MNPDLWPLAWRHGAYIYNRMPHSGLDWKSPYELFHGKAPDLSNVRVFGSPCTAHIDATLRKKDEPHSWAGFYVGNSEVSDTTFLAFNPHTNKVRPCGQLDHYENTPELSRIISNPYTQSMFYDQNKMLPIPTNVTQSKVSNASSIKYLENITDHEVYYTKDKEHSAIVFAKARGSKAQWYPLSTVLGSDTRNFDVLHNYLKGQYSRGSFKCNEYFPLFVRVQYKTADDSVLSSYIVSTDTHDDELPYQLAVLDPLSPDGISIVDACDNDLVDFGSAIACSAQANTNQGSFFARARTLTFNSVLNL
jgi:hypothetical protein